MTEFWVSLFWAGIAALAIIPLWRIADALETHNRWQAKISVDLATIRDILNIK